MAVKTAPKEAHLDWQTAVLEFDSTPFALSRIRETIHELGLDSNEIVQRADKFLLIDLDYYLKNSPKWHGFKIEDDPNQPLEKWWWHLNKIAKGEFPIEKLPEHLKDIYKERYYKPNPKRA
ncbi:MAG: hypothetical protein GXO18_02755 [Aquificae bacterium]|nr:hypothetical protein [Aquificota bacterium]